MAGLATIMSGLWGRWGSRLGLIYIGLILVMTIFAEPLSRLGGWDAYTFDQAALDPDLGGVPLGPLGGISSSHWLGVEPVTGRDIYARIVVGARVSMVIALGAAVLTSVLAVAAGLIAGYFGGVVDQVISRTMDAILSFPTTILMIAVLSALPAQNRQNLIVIVIAVFGWPYLARVVRGQTMSLKQREFVEAARAAGARGFPIVFREILPNMRSSLIVLISLAIPGFIMTESSLSFLGIGVIPPTPSWGRMVGEAVAWYQTVPMYFIIPSVFLGLLVLSFNAVGDELQKVLDAGEAR